MKKNVIVICVDGGRIDRAQKSDIIKNFSTNSIFFSQSITYAPYTNSAIHAFISGAYGNRNGCYSYWHSSRFKDKIFKTLVDYLHENDYFTCADVVSDLVLPKKNFDMYEIFDEDNVDYEKRHCNLLTKMKEENKKGKRFFLYLHYSGIHTPVKDKILKVYNNFSQEYFKNKNNNEVFYDKLFLKAEKYLKIIQEKILELDFFKDSIILLMSDHGVSTGEKFGERAYGSFCYDYTIKTFASYNAPDLKSGQFEYQVSHVDFMPTVLKHLGIQLNGEFEKLDGISLLNAMKGEKYEEHFAYTETGNPLKEDAPPKKPNTKSIRTSEWKLIFNEYDNSKELYNLANDPNEENNLIGKRNSIENELWENLKKFSNVTIIDDYSIPLSERGL